MNGYDWERLFLYICSITTEHTIYYIDISTYMDYYSAWYHLFFVLPFFCFEILQLQKLGKLQDDEQVKKPFTKKQMKIKFSRSWKKWPICCSNKESGIWLWGPGNWHVQQIGEKIVGARLCFSWVFSFKFIKNTSKFILELG